MISCAKDTLQDTPISPMVNSVRSDLSTLQFDYQDESDEYVDNVAKVVAYAYSSSEEYRNYLFTNLVDDEGRLNNFFQLTEALSPLSDMEVNIENLGLTMPLENILNVPCDYALLVIEIPSIFQGLIKQLQVEHEAPIQDMLSVFTNLKSSELVSASKGYVYYNDVLIENVLNTKDAEISLIPMIIDHSEHFMLEDDVNNLFESYDGREEAGCPCDLDQIREMSTITDGCSNEIFDPIMFVELWNKCRNFYGCGLILEDCSNGIDDDGDGLTDCEDPECCGRDECAPCDNEEICADGIDNDGDGYIDEEDYDCCEFYANCLRDCQDDYNKVTGFHFNHSDVVEEFAINLFQDQVRNVKFSFITYSTADLISTIRQPIFTDYAWNGSFFNKYSQLWAPSNPEWNEDSYGDNCDPSRMGYFAVAWLNEEDENSSCYYDLNIKFTLYPTFGGIHNTDCTFKQWAYCQFPMTPSRLCDCDLDNAIRGGKYHLKVLGPNYIPVNVGTWYDDWDASVGSTVGMAVVIENVLGLASQTSKNSFTHKSETNVDANFGFGGKVAGKDLKIPSFDGGLKFSSSTTTSRSNELTRVFNVSDWIPYKTVLKYCDFNETHSIGTNNQCELINILDTPLDLYDFTHSGPVNVNCINVSSHYGTKHWDDIVTAYLTIETN